MLTGTPWVDRTLRGSWNRLLAVAPDPSWMPLRLVDDEIEEYGCGHYGCVSPTGWKGIVFKLTSDQTEARFVAMALSGFRDWPDGLTRYHAIYHLAGASFRGRPLFALWRDEARDVGLLFSAASSVTPREGFDSHQIRVIKQEAVPMLRQFLAEAKVARAYITPRLVSLAAGKPATVGRGQYVASREEFLQLLWRQYESSESDQVESLEYQRHRYGPQHIYGAPSWRKGLERCGVALRNCLAASQELTNTDVIYPVGQALQDALEEGLLLADIHLNNIGRKLTEDKLVITDPGHAVEFHPRWATLPTILSI